MLDDTLTHPTTTDAAANEAAALVSAPAFSRPPEGSGVGTADLHPRELDVLQLVVNGFTNSEISHRLTISHNTTKTYIRRTYRKIGVATRAQAVAWGARQGLLDDSSREHRPLEPGEAF